MNIRVLHILFIFSITAATGRKTIDNGWITEKHKGYTLVYTPADKKNINEYNRIVQQGMRSVSHFFGIPFSNAFTILIHPNRHSMDSTWQQDWKMPGLKSDCWMVASGVAAKLDMLSPADWSREACEHIYTETQKTQQLVTHELVHVFHGQLNVSPDFSNVEGLGWFVEGLATYASGQCDSTRMSEVRKAVGDNKIPKTLDDFWTGNLKYGLAGSMAWYIDKRFGRAKLKALLPFNKKADLLTKLNTTEPELLGGWKKFMQQ